MDDRPLSQTGIYTIPEASRLTGIARARIGRWLRGYEFGPPGERRRSSPVWKAQLPPLDHALALGFLDLMELRFVDAFLKAGLSLAKIRNAAALATELLGQDHPFSTQKFSTDGKRIFAELEHRERRDKSILDLSRGQFGFYEVIVPSLLKGVEFDGAGQAARWHPIEALPLVVIDPRRQFGQPIVETGGVQTLAISDAVRAEGSVEGAARWLEIPPEAVRQAVAFELGLAA